MNNLEITQSEQQLEEERECTRASQPFYVPIPESDPLNLQVVSSGRKLHLQTYRFPVPSGVERKGVIFFVHGYGAHCKTMGFFFKVLADQGFECLAMDQRGFGSSEGDRGVILNAEDIYND